MLWPHCMCAVSIARSEYYVEGRGATVVDVRWQCKGIEKIIVAAVGGKRRVLSEEGARSHDGRGGLALGYCQPSPRQISFCIRFRRRRRVI